MLLMNYAVREGLLIETRDDVIGIYTSKWRYMKEVILKCGLYLGRDLKCYYILDKWMDGLMNVDMVDYSLNDNFVFKSV